MVAGWIEQLKNFEPDVTDAERIDQIRALEQLKAAAAAAQARIAVDLDTSVRSAHAAAGRIACQLDPAAVTRRRATAESERRVTSRPAPDTMACVNALLPVAQGVAVYAALRKAADTAIAVGDGRSRSQLMADILVERVTGQTTATGVPVEINLIMSAATLFGDNDWPAHLAGHGPIPADLARRLAVSAAETEAAWLRRLYATPDTGRLIGMDSHRRVFPAGLARFIEVRDQYCTTPWCDAPIRHIDHALPHQQDGATSEDNGNGVCAQCNYARQAPRWQARPEPGPRHTLRITTPTGHTYRSTAPAPPGHPRSARRPKGRRAGPTAPKFRARLSRSAGRGSRPPGRATAPRARTPHAAPGGAATGRRRAPRRRPWPTAG